MPTIKVPSEFFKKERKTIYGDWYFAFWRELFQNSTDADAKHIDISIKQKGDLIRVTFADDGCGMPRKTLDDVYFQLGKSSKDEGTSTGGFGRARILTCFAMDYYKLWSYEYIVTGHGASYSVRKHKHTDGCKLEIGVDDAYISNLKSALVTYLSMSNLRCVVSVDGMDEDFKSSEIGEEIRQLHLVGDEQPFATVFATDNSEHTEYLAVRVNGTLMFKHYVGGRKFVTIELKCENSLDILTASRDSLKDEYKSVYDAFIKELSINTETATQPRRIEKKTMVLGGGMIVSKRRCNPTKNETSVEVKDRSTGGVLVPVHERISNGPMVNTEKDTLVTGYTDLAAFQKTEMEKRTGEEADPQSPIPSVITLLMSEDPALAKTAETYRPVNWKWEAHEGRVKWKIGGEKFRLLQAWKICCIEAVRALLESQRYTGLNELAWSIGWIFDDYGTQAVHEATEMGRFFLVRPVDEDRKPKFSTRSKMSMKELMAIAKHEAAHVVQDYHNETYAQALTNIDIQYDEWDVYREISDIRI